MKQKQNRKGFRQITRWSLAALLTLFGPPALAVPENDTSNRPLPQVELAALVEEEKRPQSRPLDKSNRERDRTSWAVYLDNDFFVPGGSDRDYTAGLAVTLSGNATRNYLVSPDPLLGYIDRALVRPAANRIGLHSFEVGLTAFTPENTVASEPLPDDRPYSSLLYLSSTRAYVEPGTGRATTTSLTLGLLGLNLAGELQNAVHDITGNQEANGWNNQISEGGELTFRYSVADQKILGQQYGSHGTNYDFTSTLHGNVGYITDVSWGLSGRAGRLRTPWWTFTPQLGEYTERGSTTGMSHAASRHDEFYFWSGFNVRLRAYNAFLEGQFRDSAVTYNRSELNNVIGEAWMGVTREFSNGFRFSYFIRGQTAEIKSGPGSRDPIWGGVIFSFVTQ